MPKRFAPTMEEIRRAEAVKPRVDKPELPLQRRGQQPKPDRRRGGKSAKAMVKAKQRGTVMSAAKLARQFRAVDHPNPSCA